MLVIYLFLAGSGITLLLYLQYRNKRKKEQLIERILPKSLFQTMKKLYPPWEADKRSKEFCEKRLKLCLFILCIGCLMAFFYEMSQLHTDVLEEGGRIERNAYGKGEKQLWLWATGEADEWREKIKLTVAERKYTQEQIRQLAENAENDLVREIMGEHNSPDKVTGNLRLVTSLTEYPFQIQWKSDHPLLLSKSGRLNQEKLKENPESKDGILIELTAELTYEEFVQETPVFVRVYPREEDAGERLLDGLKSAIAEEDNKTKTEAYQDLPKQLWEQNISFSEVHRLDSIGFLLISFVAGVTVYIGKGKELQKRVNERNAQMIKDYPQIVNKYALYYGAGMSTRAVWQKLCTDYQTEFVRTGKRHFAYEEMVAANASMADGVGEISAYESFACRCRLPKYRLFINLIEQALQKGKENMGVLLEKEAQDAFLDRKNRARIQGEEAGTRLLLPMFLMLFVLLFIIMVPAFFSFQM